VGAKAGKRGGWKYDRFLKDASRGRTCCAARWKAWRRSPRRVGEKRPSMVDSDVRREVREGQRHDEEKVKRRGRERERERKGYESN